MYYRSLLNKKKSPYLLKDLCIFNKSMSVLSDVISLLVDYITPDITNKLNKQMSNLLYTLSDYIEYHS